MKYTLLDLTFYLLIYSFFGWCAEVAVYAVTKKKFKNRGCLNLPLCPGYGFTLVLLAIVLPTLQANFILQFLTTLITVSVCDAVSGFMVRGLVRRPEKSVERYNIFSGRKQDILLSLAVAFVCMMTVLLIHPVLFAFYQLIPQLAVRIFCAGCTILILIDLLALFLTVRKAKGYEEAAEAREDGQKGLRALESRIGRAIWRRLQAAYPGIARMDEEERKGVVFAKGLCFDKLIWVFLITAFLGDMIETLFCRVTAGVWMSRSSVIYGPFSVVWGFGAVLLTVTLQRLAQKEDRYIFFAGFLIGGTYEYLCSVVTEIVFGTVFWDYSHMPLNIGGRTNVLYCIFWGLLSVVWVKILYPPLNSCIEKFPPIMGKVVTWVVIVFMVCDGVISAAAMVRYNLRQEHPEPRTVLEVFLDYQYDDALIERVWPNMIVKD